MAEEESLEDLYFSSTPSFSRDNVDNDYIKKLNDLEIFYNNRNIGISKTNPVYKLDVNGPIYTDGLYVKNSSIIKGVNDELILMNKGSDNSLSIDKNKSFLLTNNLGINKKNPDHTLDVEGDIKLSGSLYGIGDNKILDQSADLNFNPSNKFNKFIVNGPTVFKSHDTGGGVVVGDINIESASGSLFIQNDIRDIYNNKFLDLKDTDTFTINPESTKSTNINGLVNFSDSEYGVRVGNTTNLPISGELSIEKNLAVGNKIKINDTESKMIDMSGDNHSNIQLGTDTYLGNLNSFGDRKQASLFGNNLVAGTNNITVANTDTDGYRGLVMDKFSGINFYVSNTNVEAGNIPETPSISISNDGQLIYSMPVLEINDIDTEDVSHPIHIYIRNKLGPRNIGSMMDFSTKQLIRENIIFNSVKITESTVRTFRIKKDSWYNVESMFETSI